MADLFLRADFSPDEFSGEVSTQMLLQWARKVSADAAPEAIYRDKEGRRTLRFELAGRAWFLKLHGGVGWAEIFKNLAQARLPVLGAANEYRAVNALARQGVDTLAVAAFATSGYNPARRQSMIVTDELSDTVSLEDYCANWASHPPSPAVRMRLLRTVANIARRMHDAGINHRDFYLCHFHLDPASIGEAQPRCYLIDLHRAQLRAKVPLRWRVKDLAGLYFSAMDCGLTRRDKLRFLRHYCHGGLRQALDEQRGMWDLVYRRARKLYTKGP